MEETARRLLAAGLAKGKKDFTEIARGFGGSDQSATNWKKRGVPKSVIIKAASEWGVDAAWLAGDLGAKEPPFISTWRDSRPGAEMPKKVEERRSVYAVGHDEETIMNGYRVADEGLKRTMFLLAKDAIERFGKRRANHR